MAALRLKMAWTLSHGNSKSLYMTYMRARYVEPTAADHAHIRSRRNRERGGGIYRKEDGELVFAFSHGYGLGTNNKAEFLAIYEGLSICANKGLWNVIVESNSKLVVDMLNRVSQMGWKWYHWVTRITSLDSRGSFRYTHTVREGNRPADGLARLGSKTQSNRVVHATKDLPREICGLVVLDKVGLGVIRVAVHV
ncbi:uncharacterized protein LOC131218191 [Magnolia sinica]|uniref:uncharacterized protein LOC131218191 n=1 Tax=Magnolia sinica TaxID=86752 RepID=UPI00265A9BE1|nr:uncharacterized protein LOC131218191 [Magnolia sinica]